MVSPDEALPARPDIYIPMIVSPLHGPAHHVIPITETCRQHFAEMGTKTFYLMRGGEFSVGYDTERAPYIVKNQTQKLTASAE